MLSKRFYVNSCCFSLLKYCSRCCTWITSAQNLPFVHMIVVLQLRGDENICDLKHRENWQVCVVIQCLFCPQGLCTSHVTETMNWSCIVCWSFKQMAPVLTASEISGGKGRVKAFMAFVSQEQCSLCDWMPRMPLSGAGFPGKCFSTILYD